MCEAGGVVSFPLPVPAMPRPCPRLRRLLEQPVVQLDTVRGCKACEGPIVFWREKSPLLHLGNGTAFDPEGLRQPFSRDDGYDLFDLHSVHCGRFVHLVQGHFKGDFSSYDIIAGKADNNIMSDEQRKLARSAINREFVARTKQAREAAGFTQEQAARFLGVSLEAYQKYEQRSPLPHCHVNDFIILTKVDYTWLFSGKGRGPTLELRVVSAK